MIVEINPPQTETGEYFPHIASMRNRTKVLPEKYQKIAINFVNYRYKAPQLQGAVDKAVGQTFIEKQAQRLNGVGAELAFACLFGGKVKIGLRNNWEKDKGDVHLPVGAYVDVKFNSIRSGEAAGKLLIQVGIEKKSETDLFALMTGNFPVFYFRGFCPRKEVVLRQYKIGKVRETPRHLVNYWIAGDRLADYLEIDWREYQHE